MNEYPTFAQDIEAKFDGERIDAVVIGFFSPDYTADEKYLPGNNRAGEVLEWEEARPLLNYDYSTSYGYVECHPVYVYSRTRVAVVACYDGEAWLKSIPRYPLAGELPEYAGGG